MNTGKQHVYEVQNIVSNEVKEVYVARIWYYVDDALDMTSELKRFSMLSGKFSSKWQALSISWRP